MYNRTIWKNRSVEHPHRYTIDETGQEITLTQTPGEVYETGTPVEQGKLNNQETGIGAVYAAVLFLVQQLGLLLAKVQANVTAIAGKAAVKNYDATFTADGWSAEAPFTQTVAVPEIIETDTPLVDILLNDAAEIAETQLEEYAYIGRIDTAESAVTATCYEQVPTVALTIAIKVVK